MHRIFLLPAGFAFLDRRFFSIYFTEVQSLSITQLLIKIQCIETLKQNAKSTVDTNRKLYFDIFEDLQRFT